MPQGLEKPPEGFARTKPQVLRGKTTQRTKTKVRKERLCRGHLPALTKRQLLLPACSGGTGDALGEQNLSGKGKAPAKGILPLVSVKQGGIWQQGGDFSSFLWGASCGLPSAGNWEAGEGWREGRKGEREG